MPLSSLFKPSRRPDASAKNGGSSRPNDGIDEDENHDYDLAAIEQPSTEEQDLIDLVTERYNRAAKTRGVLERGWLHGTAMNRGNQWVAWREAYQRFQSQKDPSDPWRQYLTVNCIGMLTAALKVRATQSDPDAGAKPQSDDPIDVAAAGEVRDLLHHFEKRYGRHFMLALTDTALETSTVWEKIYWDPSAEAQTAYTDPKTGRIVAKTAAIGDIKKVVCPSYEIFPDPDARCEEEIGWIIHRKRRPLSYIKNHYGKRGEAVQGDSLGATNWGLNVDGELDAITGESFRGADADVASRTAAVLEMWQPPSPNCPKGRRIVIAGGKLLIDPKDCVWPYKRWRKHVFGPLGYRNKYGTLWALNAVRDLIELQQAYNDVFSHLVAKCYTDKPVIFNPKSSQIGLTAFSGKRNYQIIDYVGVPPAYEKPPDPGNYYFDLLSMIWQRMQDIAGVHDVSAGQVPPGVAAWGAIELMVATDNQSMAEFIHNIEHHVEWAGNCIKEMAAEFYDEPRLIACAQVSGQRATMNVRSFEALRGGGECRVEVIAGSAVPKTPAARIQQLMDMFKAGMFTLQALPITLKLCKLFGLERSDEMNDEMQDAIQQAIALQPTPQMLQQQQDQNAAVLENIKTQGQIRVVQAKAAADLQAQQLEQQARADEQRANMTSDEMIAHTNKLMPNITIGLSGKLGSRGLPSFEIMAGGAPDDPAEVKAANAPVPAGGANGKPSNKAA